MQPSIDVTTNGGGRRAGRWPKDGKHACQWTDCGLRFALPPRQQVKLCPYHRRIYQARLEAARKARWRARVRLLAALYAAAVGPPRSRS